MATLGSENLERVMLDAMHRLIAQGIEEEADKAAERVRQMVRDKAASISLEVMKQIGMEWCGGNLVITIRDQMKG